MTPARGAMMAAALVLTACNGGTMIFDKAGWAAERGNFDRESRRGAMVSGLDEAGIVAGASRDTVRGLLGDPDSTGPAADIWFLGRSATGPSFETFRVDYDPAGLVTTTGVRRT